VDHLDEISVEELQDSLDNVEGKKPTQRLLAAIAYKNDLTQTELLSGTAFSDEQSTAGLNDSTLTSRLSMLLLMLTDLGENESFQKKEQEEFEETVHEPPEEVGVDAPAWTPALVQQYLDETYGVEYSIPSCRRLLKEAGLSFQNHAVQPLNLMLTSKKRCVRTSKSGGKWTPQ